VSSATPKSIAVLGAGITGLTAAYRLSQDGHRVRVFEASWRVGGAIQTESTDGWLIERGPNSLLTGDPAVGRLIAELGLAGEQISATPAAKHRFIVRRGQPLAAPLSPPAFIRSKLFSPGAKLWLLSEFLAPKRTRTTDLSLETLIASHFGSEIVDYALNPFVAGVYAGNPQRLSARYAFPRLWEMERTHGSFLRAQMALARERRARGEPTQPGIVSFRRGLQSLPEALAARLPAGTITPDARVETLLPGKSWNVIWRSGRETRNESFDRVIAALPAPALAQLRFGPLAERPLASLDNIEHPPVASLFLGYRREQVKHPLDGFGMLVPAVEQRSVLGVIFSSSLFAGRAPEGHVALTVMVGGSRQPELSRLPASELLAAVTPDLQTLLGVDGAPVFQRHAFWPRAIPQYNLGYDVHLETMAATERLHDGLLIGGQARDGIALPACLAAGEKLAARAVK
jgi:oxygen-dependent protoporphyrinogen oxidase